LCNIREALSCSDQCSEERGEVGAGGGVFRVRVRRGVGKFAGECFEGEWDGEDIEDAGGAVFGIY